MFARSDDAENCAAFDLFGLVYDETCQKRNKKKETQLDKDEAWIAWLDCLTARDKIVYSGLLYEIGRMAVSYQHKKCFVSSRFVVSFNGLFAASSCPTLGK